MKPLAISMIISLSSLAATSALAQVVVVSPARHAATAVYSPEPYHSTNIIYISGDGGMGTLATPDQPLFPADGITIDSASYRTSSVAGGASIGFKHGIGNFLIGSEFGYDYNGNAKYTEDYTSVMVSDTTTYRISSQDVHFLGTGTVLFRSGFNIFAKGGAARVDQSLKISNTEADTSVPFLLYDSHYIGYKPMAAAGIGFQFRNIDIYSQYSHIFGVKADNFEDLFNSNDGTFSNIVSVDTFKIGMAVNVNI